MYRYAAHDTATEPGPGGTVVAQCTRCRKRSVAPQHTALAVYAALERLDAAPCALAAIDPVTRMPITIPPELPDTPPAPA